MLNITYCRLPALTLSAIFYLLLPSCGSLDTVRKGEKKPESAVVIRVKAQTPKARLPAGFLAAGFATVDKAKRCTAIEDFFKAYYQEYLQGLQLSEIRGKCVEVSVAGIDSYQLDVTFTRISEQLSFRTKISVDSARHTQVAFNKLTGDTLTRWNPQSEEFILHVNLSHIEPSVAQWVGVD